MSKSKATRKRARSSGVLTFAGAVPESDLAFRSRSTSGVYTELVAEVAKLPEYEGKGKDKSLTFKLPEGASEKSIRSNLYTVLRRHQPGKSFRLRFTTDGLITLTRRADGSGRKRKAARKS